MSYSYIDLLGLGTFLLDLVLNLLLTQKIITSMNSMATISNTQSTSTSTMMVVSGMSLVTSGFGAGDGGEAEDTGECKEAEEGDEVTGGEVAGDEVAGDEVTGGEVGPCVIVVVGRIIATAGGGKR